MIGYEIVRPEFFAHIKEPALTVNLVRQFYLWVMREPEAAAQWLKGETERKNV